MTSSTTRLRTPEEIALHAGLELPRLRLPGADVFAQRALRLRQLAAGHALRDYLMLLAVVAEAQHARLAAHPAVPLPSAEQAEAAARRGQPLLADWPRDARWQSELHALLTEVLAKLPEDNPARAGVQAVLTMDAAALDAQAERQAAGRTLGLDVSAAPFIAAGLQLHTTHLVRATAAALCEPFGLPQDATRCPCCGSLPVASVVHIGGQAGGYRYLHCGLCSAGWHMVRVKCAHCASTAGIQYQSLQALAASAAPAKRPAVQAETCDSCGHYLKQMLMEVDPEVEPLADDLATLTLDLLVGEAGFHRHGSNPLLVLGEDA